MGQESVGQDVVLRHGETVMEAAERAGEGGVVHMPEMPTRPETGVMVFGDDWPGVFIRGDNALHFAITLEMFLKKTGGEFIEMSVLGDLVQTLMACRAHSESAKNAWPLRPIQECVEGAILPMGEMERLHVERALRIFKGNKSKVARELGMDRRTLYRKLASYAKADASLAAAKSA